MRRARVGVWRPSRVCSADATRALPLDNRENEERARCDDCYGDPYTYSTRRTFAETVIALCRYIVLFVESGNRIDTHTA